MRLTSFAAVMVVSGVVSALGVASGQGRPDFSGKWTLDKAKTMAMSLDAKLVASATLGTGFTAEQDAKALTLHITAGPALQVTAVYALDGSESVNISPGDIRVASRSSWKGDKLEIVSTSTAGEGPETHIVETKRVMWIDPAGGLIIDRSGTPAAEVPSSRSVYSKIK